MNLAFVLVHYHTPRLLHRAVSALRKDLERTRLKAEIIVVDNGSEPSCHAEMEALPARVIRPETNTGYAGGFNLGAAEADADVLVCMNPDVEILPGCIEQLVKELAAGTEAAAPVLFWDHDLRFKLPPLICCTRMEELVRAVSGAYARRRWRVHARRHWLAAEPMITESLVGAMLAIRRDTYKRIGPFDEKYRLYYEEADWLKRLFRSGGKAVLVPQAQAVHHFNQSGQKEPQAARWYAESRAYFMEQHYGRLSAGMLNGLPQRKTGYPAAQALPPGPVSIDAGLFPDSGCWVELAAAGKGYPAAAERLECMPRERWSLPGEAYESLAPGAYSLTIVSDAGEELRSFRFER